MNLKKAFIHAVYLFAILFCANVTAQTVSIRDMKYIDGRKISGSGPIQIKANESSRIQFTVVLGNPGGAAGKLKVYTRKSSSDTAKQVGREENITFQVESFSSSQDITLYASDFNETGGVIFAQFEKTIAGTTKNSNSYSIQVTGIEAPISNNSIFGNQVIRSNMTPAPLTGNKPKGGNGSYSYQWQSKTTGGWSNIHGATAINFAPGKLSTTTQYRRVVRSGSVAPDTSNILNVIVDDTPPLANNTISSNQTILLGNTAQTITGTKPTGGNGSYTYTWRKRAVGGSWSTISDATSQNYAPGSITVTTEYQRIVRSKISSLYTKTSNSNVSKVTITIAPITNNVITGDDVIYRGGTPNIIYGTQNPSGGNGKFEFLWQEKTLNGNWTTIESGVFGGPHIYGPPYIGGHDLNLIIGTNRITTFYRRVLLSEVTKPSYSNEVKITYIDAPAPSITNNIIGSNQSIKSGGIPAKLIGQIAMNTLADPWYIWKSKSGNEDWKILQNPSNSKDYNPGKLYKTTSFRREIITFLTGQKTSISNTVTITVTSGKNSQIDTISEEKSTAITVYPNPTSETLNFETNNSSETYTKISLYSVTGQESAIVFEGVMTSGKQITTWQKPTNFAKGVYFYRIVSANNVKTGKVVFE